MSKQRLIPLPLKGLDTRSSFGTPQESLSSATRIRVIDQTIRRGGDIGAVSIGGTPGFIMRNLAHAFFAQPAHDENILVALSTTGMATYTATTYLPWESGYNINMIINQSGHFRPRFAWANSAHKFVWTMAEAVPAIRVRSFDGTGITLIAQDYSARHLIAYNKRIVLADTFENSVRNSSRIRWSANGNFLDWTGLGSGFLEIGSNTSSGRISAFNNFDEVAIISLQHEFIELLPTGSLFPVFELGRHHVGVGVAAPRTWQVWNHLALYLGADNVYAWDQQKFTAIGDPIAKKIRPYLDPYRMMTIQGVVLPARGEYYLLMASGVDEGAVDTRIFVYDLKGDRWFEDAYAGVSALGYITQTLAPAFFVRREYDDSLEFLVATNNFDQVYVEKSFLDTEAVPSPDTGFTTQDFFALNSQDIPDMNAKNEFLSLTFRTHANTTVNVGVSVNKGVSFIGTTAVTSNAEGLAIYHFMTAFSHIRFTFGQRTGQFPLMIEGPLMVDWERVGETY